MWWRLCCNYAPVTLLRLLESPRIRVRIFYNSSLFRLAGHLTALARSSNTKDPAMFIDHFDQPPVSQYRCLLKLHTIIQSGRRGGLWGHPFSIPRIHSAGLRNVRPMYKLSPERVAQLVNIGFIKPQEVLPGSPGVISIYWY